MFLGWRFEPLPRLFRHALGAVQICGACLRSLTALGLGFRTC